MVPPEPLARLRAADDGHLYQGESLTTINLAISLLTVSLFVLVNLVLDLVHPLIDPRIRLGGRNTA
ncbi:hypothetical protein [Streptomyces sp. NPDC090022]|uniref:hypothetical protein n=1 Tax=Streptomyces sp. NPDC090022 TaxID=3365920 RepID=UPI003814F40D